MAPIREGQFQVRCSRIDAEQIVLHADADVPVDVCFDGRRIYSFWTLRDSVREGSSLVQRWPPVLRRFLDGVATVTLVDHVSGDEIHRAQVMFGSGHGAVRVEDAQGNPLALDKSMRLSRLFHTRTTEHLEPLLASIGTVVSALEDAGVEPFLAYGTLLGAVRNGDFIGHDSDADLGYVSAHATPVDAIRESFRLQRVLVRRGFVIARYSGLAFKVMVRESDGVPRGLDVFGGLMLGSRLYLMGEVGADYSAAWLWPRSEVLLQGRPFPAPAEPERLLEAMYGPDWRIPDPAYKFETPMDTRRRLNGWFRGTRVGLEQRWTQHRASKDGQAPGKGPSSAPSGGPSDLVRWLRTREPDATTIVDIGCGDGSDALWLAGQGVSVRALDYFPRGFQAARRKAGRKGLPATFEWVNLSELRSVLVTGADLARQPGPRVAYARHVADSTDAFGRRSLLRLARMATGTGGRFYLEFQVRRTREERRTGTGVVDPTLIEDEVGRARGKVVERIDLDEADNPVARRFGAGSTKCRMVITWT